MADQQAKLASLKGDEFKYDRAAIFGRGGRGGQGGPGGRPQGGFGRGGQGGPGGFMRMFPVMVALDSDGNGEISSEEIKGAVAALKKLDKNKDGKLTEDELRPSFGGRGGASGQRPSRGGQGRGAQRPGRCRQSSRCRRVEQACEAQCTSACACGYRS